MDFYNVITNVPLNEASSNVFATGTFLDDNIDYSSSSLTVKRNHRDISFSRNEMDAFDNNYYDLCGPNIADNCPLMDLSYEQVDTPNALDDSDIAISSGESTPKNTRIMQIESNASNIHFLETFELHIQNELMMNKWPDNNMQSFEENGTTNLIEFKEWEDGLSKVHVKVMNSHSYGSSMAFSPNNEEINSNNGMNAYHNTFGKPIGRSSVSKEKSGGGIIQWLYNNLCQRSSFLEWENRPLLIFRIKHETKNQLAAAWFKTRKGKVKERELSKNYDYFA